MIYLIKWLFGKNQDKYGRSSLEIISTSVKLSCWWNCKKREPGMGCCNFISRIASRNFDISFKECENSIIGYVEYLESEVKRLKELQCQVKD